MKTHSLSAALVTQGKHKFFTLTLPIEILANTCFVSNRQDDPDGGFQRVLDENRAAAIAKYIDQGFGVIPTSIILSAQEESSFEYDSKKKTINFKETPKAFLILDGQHRVYGFKMSTSTLRVPVVIFNGLTRSDEAKLFIDINTEQKPVPNELLLDIKKLARYENMEEEFLRSIFDLFHSDAESCMLGLMSPSRKVAGKLSRVTFYKSLKPILTKVIDNDYMNVYVALNNYLRAFQLMVQAHKLSISTITSPTLFTAIIQLFPYISVKVRDRYDESYAVDNFIAALKPISINVKANLFQKPGTSYKKVYDTFISALNKETIKF